MRSLVGISVTNIISLDVKLNLLCDKAVDRNKLNISQDASSLSLRLVPRN